MVKAEVINYPQTNVWNHLIQTLFVSLIIFAGVFVIYSQQTANHESNDNVIVIDEVKDAEVFSFGKTVLVKKGVKGVLVFGGDIIVEGKVDEDVATIGGSVIQKNDAFIGGDVIIFGGKYQHERQTPLRNADKETILYAGYEDELRNLMKNPLEIFSPQLTVTYLFWRLFSILFWFLASLLITTIAPGFMSRSVANLQLSTLKIVGVGWLAFILITVFVISSLGYLPPILGGIVSILGFVTILTAYFIGRITVNVSLGKYFLKNYLPDKYRSESLGIFLGTLVWVVLLSIPYLGNLLVVLLFAASLGLLLTSRSNRLWQNV